MAVTLDATVGGTTSNSYETVAEAQAYFDTRLPVAAWDTTDQPVALMMGTRVLDAMAMPFKTYVPGKGGSPAYFIVRKQWTGAPATTTQKLAWPRTGMYDMNGNVIPSNVIPQALKDALSELAGGLATADSTLDSDVIIQGISSIKAGSVSLSFKDMIEKHVLPDMVWNLMPPSWFTEEVIIPAGTQALFDIVSY